MRPRWRRDRSRLFSSYALVRSTLARRKVVRKQLLAALATVTLVLLLATPAGAQQMISGTVRDATTGQPVETAQVYIPGTNIGTLTDINGRYSLVVVPAGRFEVRVEIIGYSTVSETVVVAAGETAVADFEIRPTVLRLQELVVTGTAAKMPRAKLPFTVEKIDRVKERRSHLICKRRFALGHGLPEHGKFFRACPRTQSCQQFQLA